MGTRGEVFSSKANTAKRTYFFNVKENRTGDLFLSIVESKKSEEDRCERRTVNVVGTGIDWLTCRASQLRASMKIEGPYHF